MKSSYAIAAMKNNGSKTLTLELSTLAIVTSPNKPSKTASTSSALTIGSINESQTEPITVIITSKTKNKRSDMKTKDAAYYINFFILK